MDLPTLFFCSISVPTAPNILGVPNCTKTCYAFFGASKIVHKAKPAEVFSILWPDFFTMTSSMRSVELGSVKDVFMYMWESPVTSNMEGSAL